jgi:hypothetical protein
MPAKNYKISCRKKACTPQREWRKVYKESLNGSIFLQETQSNEMTAGVPIPVSQSFTAEFGI